MEAGRVPGPGEGGGGWVTQLAARHCGILMGMAGPLLGQVSAGAEAGAEPVTEGLGRGQTLL